jgi:hypothetical protein
MSDAFGEKKKSFLERLFGGGEHRTVRKTVRRTEQLTLSCPTEKAELVRTAAERWLRERGVEAAVTTEEHEPGKSRVRAKLSDEDAAKVDFRSEAVQAELQDVVLNALGD